MAFTAAQKTLMYEMLELFQGGTYDWYDYREWNGVVTSVPFGTQISFSTATDRLDAILTAIEAGSDGRESRIGSILTEYSDISFNTEKITGGGVDSAPGVRWDSDGARRRLTSLLQLHLGIQVYKYGFTSGNMNPGQRSSPMAGYVPR